MKTKPETLTIALPEVELNNEVDRRTNEPTGTYRGEDLQPESYSFGAQIDFELDPCYSVDCIRDRLIGFVREAVGAMAEGGVDKGGKPLFEKLPDFIKSPTEKDSTRTQLQIVVRVVNVATD